MRQDLLHNDEAEVLFLGGLINSPDFITEVHEMGCNEDWFTSADREAIWSSINAIHEKNHPVDSITIHEKAKVMFPKMDLYPSISHSIDLGGLLSATKIIAYAKILKDKALKRKLDESLVEARNTIRTDTPGETVLHELEFKFQKLEAKDSGTSLLKAGSDMLKKFKTAMKVGYTSIPSRWIVLQRKSGGYVRGKPAVIAARPGVGKTTFMTNEALDIAIKGFSVAIFTLEMETEEIIAKMACDLAGLDLFDLMQGNATSEQLKSFQKAVRQIDKLDLHIFDGMSDIAQITNTIRRLKIRKNLDIAFIDYVQLITAKQEKRSRREEVDFISKSIARTCKKTGVAGVILSQIGRSAESSGQSKEFQITPKLHHLKESGSLEEDAYQVMLLYIDPAEGGDVSQFDNVPMICEIAKNRSGPLGKVNFIFCKPHQRFIPPHSFSS